MEKPLLKVGYGSGDPASCPGFRPLNPWGRPMPKPERPPRPPLWQVFVKEPGGRVIPVGPQGPKETAEMFCIAIGEQIALGAERRWSSPHIVMTQIGKEGW